MFKQRKIQTLITANLPKSLEELSMSELQRKHCISKILTHTLHYLTQEFTASGFEWLLPVVLSRSTDPLWPDACASIEKRVEVEIYGTFTRVMTSMIVHKMVACSLVIPKLFVLSPNVRIERSERAFTGMHVYEFTQLDFEVRDATSSAIRFFVEKFICGLIDCLRRNVKEELTFLRGPSELSVPRVPFRVFDRIVLEKECGRDWEVKALEDNDAPFWVVNIPREFYDFEDFESGKWDNYDLYLPEYGEVLSGARREFEYEKIVSKMDRAGIRKENYSVLLKLAKEGKLKPSAGAGVGLERLVSWIVGARHVGEVQFFPKIPGIVYDL